MSIVYFIRGLPGSGKSTFARQLLSVLSTATEHIEADRHFIVDGEYQFEGRRIPEVHAKCREQYARALEFGHDVVVSNVSAKDEHVETYRRLAEEAGYTFFSLVLENRHGGTNSHNVPDEALQRMRNHFDLRL